MRNREEKDRARLIGELYLPLPGQDITVDDVDEGPWSASEMTASFRAMQVQMGGGTG